MAEKQQKKTFSIPEDIDALGRRVLGRMIIDFIQDRTARGKDISGGNFAPYSTSYKDSKDFEIAGKSSLVNLQLTGDMMASMEVLSDGVGFIVIGFEAGSEENDKAKWVSDSERGPSRDFLGLSTEDLNLVIRRYREANPVAENTVNREARSIFNRILGNG